MGIFIDRVGHRFGNLIVQRRLPNEIVNGSIKVVWECLCDCGNTKVTKAGYLISGRTLSCGCLRKRLAGLEGSSHRKDLAGKVFGHLKAVKPTDKRYRGNVVWELVCVCGKTTFASTGSLKSKNKTSCGCKRSDIASDSFTEYKHLPFWKENQRLTGSRFRTYMGGAKARGIPFEITIDEAWDLFIAQNGICAFTGLPLCIYPGGKEKRLTTASLDRIDSSQGYTKSNVQWIHKAVNQMKMAMKDEVFIQFCKLVSEEAEMKAIA